MSDVSALSIRGIVKRYPGVTALDNVNLEIRKNEIHAVCGENGAGKSTLIKILTGAVSQDEGSVFIDGTERKNYTPHEAMFKYVVDAKHKEVGAERPTALEKPDGPLRVGCTCSST